MRPVVKGNDPPYTTKTTFDFGGANIALIKKVLRRTSATNVPIADCLAAWLLKAKGDLPLGGTRTDQNKAVSAIQKQVASLYKLASVPLTQRIGPFCSFCETQLPGLLEVEHCVPKANYPTFTVSWVNFLMACSPCNIAKSNHPDRAIVDGWMGNPANPTEQQYYNEIRNRHYVWADQDRTAYRWLEMKLSYYNTQTGQWEVMHADWAANLNNELISVDLATREVIARIYEPLTNNFSDDKVRVIVVAASGNGSARSTELIALCKLNEHGNAVSTYDRRMVNRTVAWFHCLKFLRMVANAPDQPTKQIFMQALEMMAVVTGFYSVWLTLIEIYDHRLAVNFVTDTNKALYYPGTDTAFVP
jgi:5-methylcytosine-specific restriction endonuclease McrA